MNRFKRKPTESRFKEKILINEQTGCWIWTSTIDKHGYGSFYLKGTKRAHRVSYELFAGTIPEGLVIDHLCRNRACVNPAHLEPVTDRENRLRGTNPFAKKVLLTHCKYGHEFTESNTYRNPNKNNRECRTCIKILRAKHSKKQKI